MKRKYRIVMSFFLGAGLASAMMLKLQQECINKWKTLSEKNRGLFLLMDQWTNIKQEGKKLDTYFIENKYKRIAIYGMSYVGLRLVKELRGSKIEIVYGIDRNAANIYSDVKIITLNDNLENVDAIVVTLVDGFDEIRNELARLVNCPVIAIEDIINEI